MRKVLLLLFFSVSLGFVSCSKDDDDSTEVILKNQMIYEGRTFSIDSVFIEDYGINDGQEEDGTRYYNYDFYLFGKSGDEALNFITELYAPLENGDTFRTGTFENLSKTNIDSFYHLSFVEFKDKDLESDTGNIKVEGQGETYTISGNLTLENGESIEIGYSGKFEIIDRK
ncbi:hypothetical protein NBT05_14015 [Aquimarina sp. ERC-38]|uniref:hypothetical protein n=1 Tax=Aquimarina sp. ERC-38 TaxID=2949996 RepID=UPI002246FF10|nr:hypothetical protein [Aquimarina sp. ERC-38]UZO80057.1 hypothetical protein NBT05_14015 [Aquimarina sp. ERC-38]